jgi:cell division septal protein FtsQ
MATRTRGAQDKKQQGRAPAIYRGPNTPPSTAGDRPELQQVRTGMAMPWRLFSGLIVAGLLVVLFLFFGTDAFFVRSISVGGLNYLNDREVFALSGIAGEHVFWVDPAAVRENLLRSPTIADANVIVGWGNPMVTIEIEEREPALVWQQAGIAVWVDVNGRVMRQRGDRSDLLTISVDSLMDGPPGGGVDPSVVTGALQIQALLPQVSTLRYHPDYGLGFNDSRGWEAWFGVGGGMPEKISIYNALVNDLSRRGIAVRAIFVINPDRPWISTF